MTPQIDVLIPTNRDRLWNCLFQIRAALANPLNVRVTVAMSGHWFDLWDRLSEEEHGKIRWIADAPDGEKGSPHHTEKGYMGMPKILWCLENLDWADWFAIVCDDDAILPWGLESLWNARAGNAMVIGQALTVSRKDHLDFTPYTVGRNIERCRVGMACALFNMRFLETLERPWWNQFSGYADWEIIKRMADNFPYRIIPSAVHVLSICELKDLPPAIMDFVSQHSKVKD